MPLLIQCSTCGKQLSVPDNALGKRVKCPGCGGILQVPGGPSAPAPGQFTSQQPQQPPPMPPAAPYSPQPQQQYSPQPQPQYAPQQQPQSFFPPEQPTYREDRRRDDEDVYEAEQEDYDDEDRPRRKRKASRSDWARVRTGVTLVLTGILVFIGTYIAVFCFMFTILGVALGSVNPRTGNPNPALGAMTGGVYATIALFGLGYLAFVALTVTGNVFCTNAPQTAGAKALAMTSMILLIASLVLFIIAILMQVFSTGLLVGGGNPLLGASAGTGMAGAILQLLAMVTSFAHLIVFQLLLRALAVALRRDGLATGITAMMIVGGICILAFVGMFGFLVLGATSAASMGPGQGARDAAALGGMMGVLSGCTFFILLLTWFIWYIVSLILVRSAISDRIG